MKISKRNIQIGSLIIFIIWSVSGLIIYNLFDAEERGGIGDMFGAINSLFSGLALFGIIISILIQQNELNLQRKELADTRLEFKTNRVTVIMFKQLDYLNSVIDKVVFALKDPENDEILKTSIDEFIYSIDDFFIENNKLLYEKLINDNEIPIRLTSSKIISVLDGLDNLFESSNLDKLESKQMRKTFKMNINPSFLKLLFYKSLFVKHEFSEDVKINRLEKLFVESDKEQYDRISKYGEED